MCVGAIRGRLTRLSGGPGRRPPVFHAEQGRWDCPGLRERPALPQPRDTYTPGPAAVCLRPSSASPARKMGPHRTAPAEQGGRGGEGCPGPDAGNSPGGAAGRQSGPSPGQDSAGAPSRWDRARAIEAHRISRNGRQRSLWTKVRASAAITGWEGAGAGAGGGEATANPASLEPPLLVRGDGRRRLSSQGACCLQG